MQHVCLLLQIQGLPFLDELALHHKPSSTLILTDTAFNFDEACLAALQPGLALRAYLSYAVQGRCCMTKPFGWLIKDAGGRAVCVWFQVAVATVLL